MFIQVIQGQVKDRDLLQRQTDKWRREIKPKATGFLGSTSGITDDGTGVVLVRFDSAESARKNSERPEQGTWWEATAPAFAGDVTFIDCDQVDLMFGGGSGKAGFVQVMHGRAVDPVKMREMGESMEADMGKARPDILGGIVGWYGDRQFVQAIYFESEQAARSAEKEASDGPEMEQWEQMLDGPITFLDLKNPDFE
jgi:hypothetical protein